MPDTKRKFSIEKKHWLFLACFSVIISLALLYLFVYIPDNEKHLNQRLFANLARVISNIESKQKNTISLLEGLLPKGEAEVTNSYKDYFSKGFSGRQRLFFETKVELEITLMDSIQKAQNKKILEEITLGNDSILHAVIQKRGSRNETVSMQYSTNDFFSPLLSGTAFNEYIVVVNGKIAFQTIASGMEGTIFDSLIRVSHFQKGLNNRVLTVAGKDYQAFIGQFNMGSQGGGGILVGLKDGGEFLAEKNQLPPDSVLLVITFTLIVLVLLPWFKLFNMGKRDRLNLLDGAFCFMVAMLLVSFLFFGFVSRLPVDVNNQTELAMKRLADSISQRSKSYLTEMGIKLEKFTTLAYREDRFFNNLIFFRDTQRIAEGIRYDKKTPHILTSQEKLDIATKFVKDSIFQFFVLDANNGDELISWTKGNWNAPPSNLSQRRYFSQAKETPSLFAIEPIISLTSGTFRTVMAKRNPNPDINHISCISFELSPVINAVLPAGFSFAITDKDGNVLYHKNPVHNLNENLAEETNKSQELKTMLRRNTSGILEAKYKGSTHDFFIQPLQSDFYDFRLIVLYDNMYETVRNTGIFSFTIIMLMVFFLLGLGQMIVVLFASAGKSKLNVLKIETDWIWPKPSLSMIYLYAGWYQLFVVVALLVLLEANSFMGMVFALLISISLITLYLNFLFIDYYRDLERSELMKYKMRNIIAISILYTLFNLAAFYVFYKDQKQITSLLIYQISLVFAGFVFYFIYRQQIRKNTRDGVINFSKYYPYYLGNYSFLAITRLVISSGIPIWLFYQHAFQHQMGNMARYKHLTYFEDVKKLQPNNTTDLFRFHEKIYQDGYWINNKKQTYSTQTAKVPTGTDSITNELLNSFRVYKNQLTRVIDGSASYFFDNEKRNVFSPIPGKDLQDKAFSTVVKSGGQFYELETQMFYFHLIKKKHFFLLFTIIVILGLLLPRLVKKVIRQVFALDIPGNPIGDKLAETLTNFSTGSKLTYITGLPGARKMKFIQENTTDSGRITIDLFDFAKAIELDKGVSSVVFNHFEYVIYDKRKTSLFIDSLEKCLTHDKKPAIFIVSTIHVDRAVTIMSNHFLDDSEAEAITVKEKLQVLLGHFNAIILPIRGNMLGESNIPNTKGNRNWDDDEFLISPYIERLRIPINSHLLSSKPLGIFTQNQPNHANPLVKKLIEKHNDFLAIYDDGKGEMREEAIWHLHNIVLPFYHHIWQSLCAEERYLVYDLAEEGLVNPTNKYHLGMLIQKGLVKRRENYGQLELMNDSFRIFVLMSVDKSEAMEIGKSLKGSSSWDELKNSIMLMIVGILAILLVSQQKVFSSVIGYLTAITALIPMLNTLFSLIKSGQSSKT